MAERDIELLKAKALEEGMPYQSLVPKNPLFIQEFQNMHPPHKV
jgi:predicted DNA binding CopG/RHH family protein